MPVRTASGLVLPDGYMCEQCREKEEAIAALEKHLGNLEQEVERMHREVGNAIANRVDKRKLIHARRLMRKGHGRPARPSEKARARAAGA